MTFDRVTIQLHTVTGAVSEENELVLSVVVEVDVVVLAVVEVDSVEIVVLEVDSVVVLLLDVDVDLVLDEVVVRGFVSLLLELIEATAKDATINKIDNYDY